MITVDSLRRGGTDYVVMALTRHTHFPYRMAQNSQTRQLQVLLDTYTYSRSVSVPAKTLKVRKIHSYNDLHPPQFVQLHVIISWP